MFIPETTMRLLANRCMLPFGPKVFAHVISVSAGFHGAPVWVPKARPRALDSNQAPGTGTKVNAWSNFTSNVTDCEAKRSLIELLL